MGTFFLTAVDTDRLNIRGSRDPLGLVPIWAAFGRQVVGNLTTASNSARGFSTLLLGLYLSERAAAGDSNRDARRLQAFLTFEQLAGYARFGINGDTELRGIKLVRKRWQDTSIRVGGAVRYQILSNQKTYGLWGLFITPAVDSGLVLPKENVLTPAAREFVQHHYLPVLRRNGRDEAIAIEGIMRRDAADIQPRSRHRGMIEALAEVLALLWSRPFHVDWKRLAREAGHTVSGGGTIEVRLAGGGRHRVHVELQEERVVLRAWSVIARRSTLKRALAESESPLRYAWARNRLSDLVGFAVDANGCVIGETWIALEGITSEELDLHLREIARLCNWHEFRLSGTDEF